MTSVADEPLRPHLPKRVRVTRSAAPQIMPPESIARRSSIRITRERSTAEAEAVAGPDDVDAKSDQVQESIAGPRRIRIARPIRQSIAIQTDFEKPAPIVVESDTIPRVPIVVQAPAPEISYQPIKIGPAIIVEYPSANTKILGPLIEVRGHASAGERIFVRCADNTIASIPVDEDGAFSSTGIDVPIGTVTLDFGLDGAPPSTTISFVVYQRGMISIDRPVEHEVLETSLLEITGRAEPGERIEIEVARPLS